MRRALKGAAVLFCAGALLLGAGPETAHAAGTVLITGEQSLGGLSVYLESFYDSIKSSDEEVSAVTLFADEVEIPDNVAIANVSEILNVRKGPSTDYELVAYLASNAYCYILEEADDGWVKIQSGDVVGYVKKDYLYTDDTAVSMAQELGSLVAVIEGYSVNLRSEPTSQSEDNIIAQLGNGEQYEVLEENVLSKDADAPLWVKVDYNGSEGYICKTLVTLTYNWQEAQKITPSPTPVPTAAPTAAPTPTPKPTQAPKAESEETKETESESSTSDTSELRSLIIETARKSLGVPYVWAGNSLTSGADCSGFCLAVYRACGIDTTGFNRSSYDIAVSSKGRSIKRSELKPGDFVFYGKNGKINHVALYYGDGKIIHESSYDGKCVISSLDYSTPMKYMNFLGD